MTTAQETYAILENQSLWATAARCHEVLAAEGIPHAVVGGIAVCLYGYQRNTVDVNILAGREQQDVIHARLQSAGFAWDAENHEYRDETGIAIHFVMAGEPAGRDSEVRLPNPGDSSVVQIMEGLPALTLARLIDSKIACGEGNLRRTHKDFADVVELIAVHGLDGGFASQLHKSVRRTFRQLVRHARGES